MFLFRANWHISYQISQRFIIPLCSNLAIFSSHLVPLWFDRVVGLSKLLRFGRFSSSRYLKHILFFSNSKYSWRYERLPSLTKWWNSLDFGCQMGEIHEIVWYMKPIQKNAQNGPKFRGGAGKNPSKKKYEKSQKNIFLACWKYD